ncbi:MAG: rRNA pseudouridine synthase [Spirochaetia bacterium]|nr:rRNA pseudouridine synthase [Spirochaetia bacterium]
MRIQKFLRDQGMGSLRKCDELVAMGRVEVNGEPLRDPTAYLKAGDRVSVLGRDFVFEHDLRKAEIYLRYHKPPNRLATHDDPFGRRTIFEDLREPVLMAEPRQLLFAGRLDYASRGLMVLSTDGKFIQRLTHPSGDHSKEYEVTTEDPVRADKIAEFSKGMMYAGERYSPFEYKIEGPRKIRMTLHEGRKHEVRNIIQAAGTEVVDLLRVRMGTYNLQGLDEGQWEMLSDIH